MFLFVSCCKHFLGFTVLLYSVQKGTVSKLVGQLPDLFFYNKQLSMILLWGLFSAIFLIKSYKKFIILGQVSVFEADAYGLHDELFWFTLSKYCYILSLLFLKIKISYYILY